MKKLLTILMLLTLTAPVLAVDREELKEIIRKRLDRRGICGNITPTEYEAYRKIPDILLDNKNPAVDLTIELIEKGQLSKNHLFNAYVFLADLKTDKSIKYLVEQLKLLDDEEQYKHIINAILNGNLTEGILPLINKFIFIKEERIRKYCLEIINSLVARNKVYTEEFIEFLKTNIEENSLSPSNKRLTQNFINRFDLDPNRDKVHKEINKIICNKSWEKKVYKIRELYLKYGNMITGIISKMEFDNNNPKLEERLKRIKYYLGIITRLIHYEDKSKYMSEPNKDNNRLKSIFTRIKMSRDKTRNKEWCIVLLKYSIKLLTIEEKLQAIKYLENSYTTRDNEVLKLLKKIYKNDKNKEVRELAKETLKQLKQKEK